MAVLIRLATADDAPEIARIYTPYVETTRITFEEQAPDAPEIVRRMANPIHPWLVIEDGGAVAGYASTSPMRVRAAYRWSVETGVYLRADAQGRGLGRNLLAAHLDLLTLQGFVAAFATVGLPNPASVALHESLGYTLVGIERGCGFKLGTWADVGRWQKDLAPRAEPPSEPRPYSDFAV
ncbi:MAG: N-acetyltransferase family protein [Sphingomicrobium sp.]